MENFQVEMIYFGSWIQTVQFTALSSSEEAESHGNISENERYGRGDSPNVRDGRQRGEEYRKE